MSEPVLCTNPSTQPTPVLAWRRTRLVLVQGSVVSLAVVLLAGVLSALYAIPVVGAAMPSLGLQFTALRPLHTVFAAAWLFLSGVAVVFWFFEREGLARRPVDRLLCRIMLLCWAIAGVGVLVTVPLGITSGREYLGFHPVFSIPILVGWLAFTAVFFRATARRIWHDPVYVMMWAVGCLFFTLTFVEQHLWLLDGVFSNPIVDRRIQWMATGSIVGAANLFVYGALYYVGEWVSGDDNYGRSATAWSLFGLALFNSFVNFGHHTYHLPQSQIVHWVSFLVTMTETFILLRVVWELAALLKARTGAARTPVKCCMVAAKWWTLALLVESIVLSVPPINTLLHGTWVVVGHAMMGMVGVDTMVLLGALLVLLAVDMPEQGDELSLGDRSMIPWIRRTNMALALFIVWFHVVGMVDGVVRYGTPADVAYAATRPLWVQVSAGIGCAVFGALLTIALGCVAMRLLRSAFARDRRVSIGMS